jgi:HD-like signal output (HDOD) protein
MPDADRPLVLDELMAAVRAHGGLPSLGHTLGKLTELLEGDNDAVHDLADVILADVSLTQRLLRLANTIPYRTGPQVVTTVTRAIMLLGFNHVRAVATSLVLLEGLLGPDKERLRSEFHQALLAGCLARELLPKAEGEEAGIAAMFRNVGRLLAGVFAPDRYAAVRALMQQERLSETAAARRMLGRSFDEITDVMLREWRLPERLVAHVQPLPPRIETPHALAERVRLAAHFADALAGVVANPQSERATPGLDDVLDRFAPAFALEREHLVEMLRRAGERTREFETAFGLTPSGTPVERLLAALPQEVEMEAAPVEVSAARDAVGRPSNAREVLLAGLAEATECLARAGGSDLNTVVRVVLEAMFSGLGYARTALALRDQASGLYRTRAGFGEPKAQFSFSTQGAPNLFSAALTQGRDLHIADVQAERVRLTLPDWFARDFAATRSFVLMPLVVNERAIGLFYADRRCVDDHGLSGEELNLLRSLRSHVVLAMRSR